MPTFQEICPTTSRVRNPHKWHDFLKSFHIAVTMMALTAGTIGCATTAQKVIEAEKIVLKDAKGQIRLQIAVDDGGGIVQTFLDAKGTERLKLMIDAEGVARQRFFDEKGALRMGSYVYPADHQKAAGFVGMDIMNKEGTPSLKLYVNAESVARQSFFDEKGTVRMGSYVFPTDHPEKAGQAGTEWVNGEAEAWTRIRTIKGKGAYHEFIDKNGKERISLNVYNSGPANQLLSDATGTTRSITYTNQDGYAGFDLLDPEQKLRFQTVTLPNGKVAQSFMDREKNEKSSTTVDADGSATHYVEKGTAEKIWNALGYVSPLLDVGRFLFGNK